MTATIPPVGRAKPMRVPPVSERTLGNGLRVVAARRPGIPRFEARLRIPTVRGGNAGDRARRAVLAETLLSGTPQRSSVEIAEAFQRLGGSLGAGADADSVSLSGSALSTAVRPFVELLAEVVGEASFPADEVAVERQRLAQELLVARSQPDTIARDALLGRLWGSHPYGLGLPDADAVAKVTPAALRRAHDTRLLPAGSVLVLVGDVPPVKALDAAEAALSGWGPPDDHGGHPGRLRAPRPARGMPILIVDRPGAVQTNIRLAGPALRRGEPRFPTLMLANAVFGGYFTSRLVDNIRERRGYTYSPGSGLEHRQAASAFAVSADVGTDVTAAALVEIRYELGRMVTTAVEQSELDAARRYLLGTLAMSIQTQAGLASYLSTLAAFDLGVEYLRAYPSALQQVTVAAVRDAATEFLAPTNLVTVLVGDASAIRRPLAALDDVEVVSPRG